MPQIIGIHSIIHWVHNSNNNEKLHFQQYDLVVERSGLGVELQTLNYDNPGSNPVLQCETLGQFFYSTLLQFTQLEE